MLGVMQMDDLLCVSAVYPQLSSYGDWGERLFLPVKPGACMLNQEAIFKDFLFLF